MGSSRSGSGSLSTSMGERAAEAARRPSAAATPGGGAPRPAAGRGAVATDEPFLD